MNFKYTVYQRRGYVLKHYVQRQARGHEHLFMVQDQGAKHIPKSKHLIRMFIASQLPGGLQRRICGVSSGTHGLHCIWYRVIVRYKKDMQDNRPDATPIPSSGMKRG